MLDGLRGVAILMVMVMVFHFFSGVRAVSLTERGAVAIVLNGWVGVDLFFVLSGFLITGILIDSKTHPHSLRNFYARRVLRIFPLYYAFLALVYLALPLLSPMITPRSVAALRADQAWIWSYSVNILAAIRGSWQARDIFSSRTTTDFDTGVPLPSATPSIGTSALASGK